MRSSVKRKIMRRKVSSRDASCKNTDWFTCEKSESQLRAYVRKARKSAHTDTLNTVYMTHILTAALLTNPILLQIIQVRSNSVLFDLFRKKRVIAFSSTLNAKRIAGCRNCLFDAFLFSAVLKSVANYSILALAKNSLFCPAVHSCYLRKVMAST
jgi:hypothetical protein